MRLPNGEGSLPNGAGHLRDNEVLWLDICQNRETVESRMSEEDIDERIEKRYEERVRRLAVLAEIDRRLALRETNGGKKTIRRRKMHGGVPSKNSLENKAIKATNATKEQLKQYDIQAAAAMKKMTDKGHSYIGPSSSPGMWQPQGATHLEKGPVQDNGDNLHNVMNEEKEKENDNENFNQQEDDMEIGGKKRKYHKKRK
jgi:hypothetical protein